MPGTLFLVVGPSGAGKDTLLDGAREALRDHPSFIFARRLITRPADAGGEAHEAATPDEFAARRARGELLLWWQAHGLEYGLSRKLEDDLNADRNVLANVSRGVLLDAAERFPDATIIEIDAPPEVRAKRLAARGREDAADAARRLSREGAAYPPALKVVRVVNDGTPEEGVARFVVALTDRLRPTLTLKLMPIDSWNDNIAFLHRQCLGYRADSYLGPGKVEVHGGGDRSILARINLVDDARILAPGALGLAAQAFAELDLPEGTPVYLERGRQPASIAALRAKVAGRELDAGAIDAIVTDIVNGRYAHREIAAFLVAAAAALSPGEVLSLARARSHHARQLDWAADMIVDKHSVGGIPGSRVTMVVVPIVAAHGLIIPKTSSRAITSAAGTADAMEALARVDLDADEVRETVRSTGGCIAWNGRLNHSPVDDVMNAITRPLGINSNDLSVASIMSKKLAAGSTHLVIDIPVGPTAKVQRQTEAQQMADLFTFVGAGLGIAMTVHLTDGTQPIGRGVGPALEARDVMQVLRNEPAAPSDLREKALFLAGHVLEFDPALPPGQGQRRALELLESGAAVEVMERIIDTQGRHAEPALPGPLTKDVKASTDGAVATIDCYRIGGIARRAGAPHDKGAGVDLFKKVGDPVSRGEPIYRIHANAESDLAVAVEASEANDGFLIE